MKNLFKKLVLIGMCCLLGVNSVAQISGQCGDRVNWQLNDTQDELSIFGHGDMWDAEQINSECIPWFFYLNKIRYVDIKDGVTSVGVNMFQGNQMELILLPPSLTKIGECAFSQCPNLKNIEIPQNVTYMGFSMFSNPYKPPSALKSITNLSKEPQVIRWKEGTNSNTLKDIDLKNATLYVPEESVEKYKAAEGWKDFGTIKALINCNYSGAKKNA
jgi:hypothetical protein